MHKLWIYFMGNNYKSLKDLKTQKLYHNICISREYINNNN